jgi:hypothetical protein
MVRRREKPEHAAVIRIITIAMLVSLVAIGNAEEVVQIRLRGHYFAEPATVQITVAVEPAADHRVLRIAADGERYFRASELALEGEKGKRLHSVEFKNLPAGAYVLVAEVHSTDSVLGKATQQLVVTSSGGR